MEDEEAYYRTPEDDPDSWAVSEGRRDLLYGLRETDHRRSGVERRQRDLIAECDRRMPGWDRRQT